MNRSTLIAVVLALTLSACGEKPAEQSAVPAPEVAAPAVVAAPEAVATEATASDVAPAAPAAMDSMKK